MKVHEHYKIIEFSDHGDERGKLVVIEGGMDIPFEIKRAFYMYGTDRKMKRGSHANRKTEFVLINISGKSKVKLDDGFSTTVVELNKPRMGIYIPAMLWKDMYDFSKDSVLLVLASEHYDSEEYIRDYNECIAILEKEKRFVKGI